MRLPTACLAAALALAASAASAAEIGPMNEEDGRKAVGCLSAAWAAAHFGWGKGVAACPKGLPAMGFSREADLGIAVVVAKGADSKGRPLLGVVRADNVLVWADAASVRLEAKPAQ